MAIEVGPIDSRKHTYELSTHLRHKNTPSKAAYWNGVAYDECICDSGGNLGCKGLQRGLAICWRLLVNSGARDCRD
jgi:hypothetical protein